MMSAAVPWPPALAGTPAVAVIERAIGRGRLSHGILMAGDDSESLSLAAMALADRLLSRGLSGPAPYTPERHPDCLQVRPAGKSRAITADAVRELVGRINVSPSVAHCKVAVLHDVDRMTVAAANVFLKTLEEPPADTTLLLLTGRPHALLATIRSRVLHFRIAGLRSFVPVEGWEGWLADYRAWLVRLGGGLGPGRAAAEVIFALYGLLARFGAMLDRASVAEVARRKASLPEDLEEGELAAIESEIAVGLRLRMFADIERATRGHAIQLLESGDAAVARPLAVSVDSLERAASLLRVNLNESAALEDFLLAQLRAWTRR